MAKAGSRTEVTSRTAATAASKVLRDPTSTAAKSAVASALTQRPAKK